MKIGSMKSGSRANAQAILANTLARDDDLPSVVELISKRLAEIDTPQTHVARLAGFQSLQMVNMIKSGKHRLPADRIVPLAEALDIAPEHLLRVWFNDYHPAFFETIRKHLGPTLARDG